MRLAVDVMSGDLGPAATLPAVLAFSAKFPHIELLLVGDAQKIQSYLPKVGVSKQVNIFHRSNILPTTVSSKSVLKHPGDSSTHSCFDLLKENKVDAVVSGASTTALMLIARQKLLLHPSIDRPALIAPMPNRYGVCHLLDIGANLSCDADNLAQFGLMGAAVHECVYPGVKAKVGLLNVGVERVKGVASLRHAADMLASIEQIDFKGFVEAGDLFNQPLDVVVTDGFTGNALIKSNEGLMKLFRYHGARQFNATWRSRLIALLALPFIRQLAKDVDPRSHNGSLLVGFNRTVIKSHGGADEKAFLAALVKSKAMIENKLSQRLFDKLDQFQASDIY